MISESVKGNRGRGLLLLLMAGLVFSQLDRLALSALVESVKLDLNLSDHQLGILQGGAFGVFYTCLGLPLGYLADRWSNRGVIICGFAVWTGATFLTGFAGSFAALLAARVGVAAGEAALSPAAYSLIRQNFPPHRVGFAISVFQFGAVIGLSSAFAIVGMLQGMFTLDWVKPWLPHGFHNWQLTFLILGLAGAIFLPAFFGLPSKPAEIKLNTVTEPAPKLWAFLQSTVSIWLPLFVGMSGVMLFLYAMLAWLPAILSREFGWGPTTTGPRLGAIVFAASSLGILLGGWLTDRINQRTGFSAHTILPLAVCSALLPLALLMMLSNSPWAILTVAAFSIFLIFMPLSVAPAFIQQWAPIELKGQVSAVYILVGNGVSLSLAPMAIGSLADAVDLGAYSLRFAALIVSLGMLVVSWAMLLGLRRGSARRAVQV